MVKITNDKNGLTISNKNEKYTIKIEFDSETIEDILSGNKLVNGVVTQSRQFTIYPTMKRMHKQIQIGNIGKLLDFKFTLKSGTHRIIVDRELFTIHGEKLVGYKIAS